MASKILHGIIATSLMTICMATSAYANVSCPSAKDVKSASDALNTVMRQSEKSYFVLTAQPAINSSDLDWLVATSNSANGFDAAFANGQKSVSSTISAVTDEPIEQGGFYLCAYLSSGGMNVMTVAQVPQGGFTFKPSMFNMDLFKQKK